MKDLDFDEIDRAVNSVISNGSGGDSDSYQPNGSTSIVPQTVSQVIPTDATPKPPVVRRSSGQFMDVVHPSSDMRRNIEVPKRTVAPAVSMSEPVYRPAGSPEVMPKADGTTGAEAMPEPYQQSEPPQEINSEPTATAKSDSYEDADIDKISDDLDKAMTNNADSSLESPFISGTKVEKRPLGAFSTEPTTESAEQPEVNTQSNYALRPSSGGNSMITPGQTPLPAELQNDLLKIEADSSIATENEAVSAEPADLTTPEIEQDTQAATESTVDLESPRDVAEKTDPAGPTSIVQQYQEKPNTGGQNSGAIYDTESYHKTLVNPKKKKSGWMWVLYAAIFLVVGVGVGVVVYLFVIPALSSL